MVCPFLDFGFSSNKICRPIWVLFSYYIMLKVDSVDIVVSSSLDRRSRGRISIGPAEPTLVTDRMFDMILWHKAKGVMRGARKTFLNIRIIYDKFIIRIIIIVVKVHNQLKIPHLNPVNKINTTLKNQ